MCQLTMIHGRTDVVKIMLCNLTLHNALSNNKDGHGYFIVPRMIWRTIVEGNKAVQEPDYITDLEEFIEDDKETAVISHVRAASYKFKDLINIDNTHPFQVDNIILMHNGTLTPEDDELEIKDRIDSLWFTEHLAKIVNNKKLTPAHITKAMEDFTGKFAFLIVDMKQPTKIFVVKGRTADLYYTTIRDGRNKVLATVINTSGANVEYSYSPMYWRLIKGTKLVIEDPEELDDESIYIYDIETSILTKTDQEIKEETTVTTTTRTYPVSNLRNGRNIMIPGYDDVDHVTHESVDEIIDIISNLAYSMDLGLTEMNLIFQLLFTTPILFAEKEHVIAFRDTMEIISADFSNRVGKKRPKWDQIKNSYYYSNPDGNALEIYQRTGINFPWFIQSGSRIKSVSNSVKSGNYNWQTTG